MQLNRKGFTLFTAIISFILISLSILLIQNMVNTESNTVSIISDIQEQDEMRALADLARADAVQVFNLNLRRQIEYYLTFSNNALDINYYTDWKGVQTDFAKTYFGGNCETVSTGTPCTIRKELDPSYNPPVLTKQIEVDSCTGEAENCLYSDPVTSDLIPVPSDGTPGKCYVIKCGQQLATFIAKNIELILNTSRDYKDFKISFSTGGQSVFDAKETFRKLIGKIITETVKEEKGLFELIEPDNPETTEIEGCSPKKPEKCKGFYLILDLTKLSPEEYEQLPKIRVSSISTARIVEEPVFPYGKFKIFIPIRLFRVMARAYALAHTPTATTVAEDEGLLSVKIHNTLEELRIGVCDPGKCGYRTDPLDATDTISTLEGEYCIGSSEFESSITEPGTYTRSPNIPSVQVKFKGSQLNGLTYLPWKTASQLSALRNLTKTMVDEFLSENTGWQETESDFSSSVARVLVFADPMDSKNVESGPTGGSVGAAQNYLNVLNTDSGLTAASTDLSGSSVGLGVYALDALKPWSIRRLSSGEIQGFPLPSGEHSSCTELTKLEVTLEFIESNPLYQVDNKEGSKRYLIELTDYFEEFNPKYKTTFGGASVPLPDPAFDLKDWTCIQEEASPGMDTLATHAPGRCRPA